ncbi:MAG TPA: FHA domain-containing protein, partial [Ilumatobacteraceae bacterium]
MPEQWTLTWVAGPDAGGSVVIGSGTHVVGRSWRATVRCDDPALELHHVLIEVAAGGARACQLSGRLPVRVDGVPLDGAVGVGSAATLEIGHSLLTIRRGGLTDPGQGTTVAATDGAQIVVRQPRSSPRFDPQPVRPPAAHPVANEMTGGLLPALLALGGAGLLAVLVHQPMFLLFGAIGAVAAFGTWGGQRIGVFRRRRTESKQRAAETRRFEHDVAGQRQLFIDHHHRHDSTAAAAQRSIERVTSDL